MDDVGLPDDQLGEFGLDPLAAGVHLVGERDVLGRIHTNGLLKRGIHNVPFRNGVVPSE